MTVPVSDLPVEASGGCSAPEAGCLAGDVSGKADPARRPVYLLRFEVHGQPAPQGSKRHVGNGVMVESSKKVKPWRQDVVAAAETAIEQVARQFIHPGSGKVIRGIELPPVPMSCGGIEFSDGTVVDSIRRVAALPLDVCVAVRMVFTFQRPKGHYRTGRNAHLLKDDAPAQPQGTPDLDKLARSSCDALKTAGLIRDDARIVEYDRLAKVWCGEDPDALHVPGALIAVRQVER